jgi:hypothetical protein
MSAFNPLGGGSITRLSYWTPTLPKSLVELTENRDYQNKPIYKEKFPGNDYKPYYTDAYKKASEHSKKISEKLNTISGGTKYHAGNIDLPPEIIDYLQGVATGGVGTFTRQLLDIGSKFSSDKISELDPTQIPFSNKFYDPASKKSLDSKLFWDRFKELQNIHREQLSMVNAKDMDEARKFMESNKEKISFYRQTAVKFKKNISDLQDILESRKAKGEETSKIEEDMKNKYIQFNDLYEKRIGK